MRIQADGGWNAKGISNEFIQFILIDDWTGKVAFLDRECAREFSIFLKPCEMRRLASALFEAAKQREQEPTQ